MWQSNWIALLGFIVAAISLVLSIISYVKTIKTEKKKLTISNYMDLQDDLYVIYEYGPGEIEDFVTDPQSREYKVLSSCIAKIEIYAIGLRNGLFDFDIFYKMAHGYIDCALRSKIEHILDIKSMNRKKEEFYENTKWLLNQMDARSCSGKSGH